jgi:3-isopropylmalate/(R)-2-methylmalate dehydratase small subunit
MTPFTALTSIVADITRDNVDTDSIIPSREMKSTGKTGLKDGLFAPWRYLEADARTPNPEFVLNQSRYAGAQILSSGANFGCGSSREHAVWALAEYGIRCIIAESFAPIFYNNCIRNGVLPVIWPNEAIAEIAGKEVTIDLANQSIFNGTHHRLFHIDEQSKTMLLEGLDAIDLSLKHADAITAFHARDRAARPWVYLNPPQATLGEGDRPSDGGGVTRLPRRTNESVLRARKLRRSLSKPEAILWSELKKRPSGLKFRKQHPAGPYTLDFYCAAARLCVEIDGESHERGDRPTGDAERDRFLKRHRVDVLRLPAREVLRNLEDAVSYIARQAEERLPLHRPADGPPPHRSDGEDL